MAALLVCAVVHTQSRIGGALATSVWCAAALVYGWFEIERRGRGVVFLEIQMPWWVYFVVVGGVLVFNLGVVVRALSRRVMARPAPAPVSPAAGGAATGDSAP